MIRVSDRNIQSNYLSTLAKSKADLATLQKQMVTQSKVNKPSDSPLGATRILRMNGQIETFDAFAKNIETGLAYIDNSSMALEGIKDEIQNILKDLTELNNPTVVDNLSLYGDKIKAALNSIVDLSNTSFDGQFLFGGSDNTTTPIGYNGTGDFVNFKSANMGADHKIKISNYTEQKINMNAKELFASVVKQKGNLNSGSAIGVAETKNQTIYNAEGLEYTFESSYTRTGANTYTMDYQILDASSNVVSNGSHVLGYNATTGEIATVDGSNPKDINITNETEKINIVFDFSKLTEKNSAANIESTLSKKSDIFNTLMVISDKLKNGEIPGNNLNTIITEFETQLINKISELGSFRNRLTDTEELNKNQSLTLQDLVSKEKDVDVAQLIIELQEKQYNLDLTYKISATLLPKSLLDFI